MADEREMTGLNDKDRATASAGVAGYERDLAAFESYWQRMRRGGDVPRRTEIDPRGIEALLSNAFIAEKIAPGLARLRIAGTHLSDVMGMEVRGMPLSSLIEPADRDRLADALVELFERPAKLRLDLAAPGRPFRRTGATGTMLVLPLRSDLGDISRALGCFVSSGPTGSAPRRFRISSCDITPISTGSESGLSGPGFAEDGPSFRGRARHASERPWLRLVHGD